MVLEDQIKWYLPLHELDELKLEHGNELVDLSADDLFLISKVSAYSTDSENAVTVSKKLKYGNFSNKLSSDFHIYKMKTDINYLSTRVDSLSSTVNTKINSLSSTVDANFIKKYGT